MAGLNKVQLIGRLGKDPEVREVSNNKVANFSLATSKKWKNEKGEVQEKTEWHNLVVWGKMAGIAGQYLKKGSMIYAEGELQTRMWEKDSVKHYITEVNLSTFQMLDPVTKADSSGQDQRSQGSTGQSSNQSSRSSNAGQNQSSGRYDSLPWENQ